MNWSSKWFYFVVISFLLYTVAGGYGKQWKQIFTSSLSNSNVISPTALQTIAPVKPLGGA